MIITKSNCWNICYIETGRSLTPVSESECVVVLWAGPISTAFNASTLVLNPLAQLVYAWPIERPQWQRGWPALFLILAEGED